MKEEIKRSIEGLLSKGLIEDQIEASVKPVKAMIKEQVNAYISTPKFKTELKKRVESELLDHLSDIGLFEVFSSKEYDAIIRKAVLSVIKQ